MIALKSITDFLSGSPQFRINESFDPAAPLYSYYSQAYLEEDLTGVPVDQNTDVATNRSREKQIRTFDKVVTVTHGDVVFSLLSGTAAIIQPMHEGYLLTQNYVVLKLSSQIDASYLVYELNENAQLRHQLHVSQQGSITMKFTLRQLKDLQLPFLPSLEKQKLLGDLYLSQLKLHALRVHASKLETMLVMETIREADQS